MRRSIYLIAFSVFIYGNVIYAQSIPKPQKTDIFTVKLIVQDSMFLSGLDSLIFNSICPEMKYKISSDRIFNVWSKKNNGKENSYRLAISLDNRVQIYEENDLKGCFDYKGYLFLWFYDIPKELLAISNQKKKLTYMKGVPHIASEHTQFVFDYSENNLILTGICCY